MHQVSSSFSGSIPSSPDKLLIHVFLLDYFYHVTTKGRDSMVIHTVRQQVEYAKFLMSVFKHQYF